MQPESPSDHFRQAVAFDASGRHDDAINELALGTQARDPHCTRLLGLRLLTGDRSPLLPQEGLRFLGEAAESGLPEAAARAAGVLALGVHIPPDHGLAVMWLARSAELGWEPAQRQLRALCDDAALAASPVGRPADWQRIAAGIQPENWKEAVPLEVLSEGPRIVRVPGLLPPALCGFFISLAPGRLERALVYDPVNRREIVAAHRSNTLATFNVDTIELGHVLLQARMAAACGVGERQMEAPSVLHYAPGEEIRDHYDFVDPKSTPDYAGEIARNGQRVVTFLAYLNDDYDGGTTDFPDLGIRNRGRTGDGLFFVNALPDMSPDLRTMHAGTPTSRGEKWIITQFVRSRKTR
ncbi:MAG: hypothetical protein RLZZ200_709 [Pseudomonadota bacterium]